MGVDVVGNGASPQRNESGIEESVMIGSCGRRGREFGVVPIIECEGGVTHASVPGHSSGVTL